MIDDRADLAERILDTALELGEHRGWDELHLHEIAQFLNVSLADIHRYYRQKDDLADLLGALVAQAAAPRRSRLGTGERLVLAGTAISATTVDNLCVRDAAEVGHR